MISGTVKANALEVYQFEAKKETPLQEWTLSAKIVLRNKDNPEVSYGYLDVEGFSEKTIKAFKSLLLELEKEVASHLMKDHGDDTVDASTSLQDHLTEVRSI
jgi:C-terminal processing protease CtpA/Prc